MKVRLELIGLGAKWSVLVLALIANSYHVTGDGDGEIVESESRSPYVYLSQREYLVQPNGDYEEVASYPEVNGTSSPPGTLKAYTDKLREIQTAPEERSVTSSSEESDQDGSASASQKFENAYTRYSYGLTDEDDDKLGQESNNSPSSIQDVLKKQGEYGAPTGPSGGSVSYPTGSGATGNDGGYASGATGSDGGYPTGAGGGGGYSQTGATAPQYDVTYQSPQITYEVPSNYFPSENYEWPNSYSGHHTGPLPLSPFLGGIGEIKSSVKHLKGQLKEQKAHAVYKVADTVKNTGDAVTHAILSKGHTAAAVVGKTVHTAGDLLKQKGWTAQKIIHNTGNLATSAVKSVGHIGTTILKTKGELVGAGLKTGAHIGSTVLGKVSDGLQGGTYLVKAKGDAASNIISKGGRLAAGVIGTKGRLISSVINAKGHFAAQIIEAKGAAAAKLLESGGQKLNDLADAIKAATARKKPVHPPPYGWSEPSEVYEAPPTVPVKTVEPISHQQHHHQTAQPYPEEKPVVVKQQAHQFSQDYADSYYDPRDYGNRYQRNLQREASNQRVVTSPSSVLSTASTVDEDGDDISSAQGDDEDFQNEYTAYYHPHHYSVRPHTDYYSRQQWEQ